MAVDRYLISKTLFFIIGASTVIIFFLLYTGGFINIVGSIEVAITIYCVNTILLVPVTIWYIVERSRKTDYEKRSRILEAYSEKERQTGFFDAGYQDPTKYFNQEEGEQ